MAKRGRPRKDATQTGMQLTTSQMPSGIAAVFSNNGDTLPPVLPKSYDSYRVIRKQPTVFLARLFAAAPVIGATYSIDKDEDIPDYVRQFVDDQIFAWRNLIVERAMYGGIDFGYQPFELVYQPKEWKPKNTADAQPETLVCLNKVKPLIQDITSIAITEQGDFDGYVQESEEYGEEIYIDKEYCLNIPFRVEGGNWYGISLLENIRQAYNDWMKASEGAARYDAKLAGANWILYYPVGSSENADGSTIDNAEIARQVLDALESSGTIAIPQYITGYLEDLNAKTGRPAWHIDVVGDSGGRSAGFLDRMKYLDVLFTRGLGLPERVLLEAEFGSKADAMQHTDLLLVSMEYTHQYICDQINQQLINHLLKINFGDEYSGKVWMSPAPMSDTTIKFVRDVYLKVLSNSDGITGELENIDLNALRDRLGIPVGTVLSTENTPELEDIVEEMEEV